MDVKFSDPYPTYPDRQDATDMDASMAPSQMKSAGTVATPPTGLVRNPYPQYGASGGQMLPAEASTKSSLYGGTDLSNNPGHAIYGLQCAMDSAMGAAKDVKHFQSGDIRAAADMSGGAKVSENPGQVSAVSAALDKAAAGRVAGARAGNQTTSFKRAAKGAKAGNAARDMQLRHAGSQADVMSATTGR